MESTPHDELQHIRAELAHMRADLDMRTVREPGWRRTASRVRSMRRLTVVGIVAIMLALPVAVSANHLFSDVPTSSTYHTTVARLAGAGITGGCGSGKYCPNAAVTRGQMAAFLNRGLGRSAFDFNQTVDDHWASLAGTIPGPAVTYLAAGGGTGGTAHVLVTGTLFAITDEPGVCPCELRMALFSSIGELGTIGYSIIGSDASPDDGDWKGGASLSHLFTVPSGTTTGFTILAQVFPTLSPSPDGFNADAIYDLQATYVPFDATGGNPPEPVIIAGESELPFGVSPFSSH